MNYKTLPEITKKQHEIMDLIYKFRFVNRKQLQQLLHHKDPKRINVWLKDLVAKKYLGRIYSNKLLENTKPAIYYLHTNGVLWVRYQKAIAYHLDDMEIDFRYIKKFYEDKHASQTFINHCLTICEFYIQFKDKEKQSNKQLEYLYEPKTEFRILAQVYTQEGEFEKIKDYIPDAYITKTTAPDSEEMDSKTFFLELVDVSVPRYVIRYKINKYIEFRNSNQWEYYSGLDGEFPVIIFILSDMRKLTSMKKYIRKRFDERYSKGNGVTFLLTTYDNAITKGLGCEDIWEEVTMD